MNYKKTLKEVSLKMNSWIRLIRQKYTLIYEECMRGIIAFVVCMVLGVIINTRDNQTILVCSDALHSNISCEVSRNNCKKESMSQILPSSPHLVKSEPCLFILPFFFSLPICLTPFNMWCHVPCLFVHTLNESP